MRRTSYLIMCGRCLLSKLLHKSQIMIIIVLILIKIHTTLVLRLRPLLLCNLLSERAEALDTFFVFFCVDFDFYVVWSVQLYHIIISDTSFADVALSLSTCSSISPAFLGENVVSTECKSFWILIHTTSQCISLFNIIVLLLSLPRVQICEFYINIKSLIRFELWSFIH